MIANYFDTVDAITTGVVAFFALVALITIIRIILRREDTAWHGLRVGFFVERDRGDQEPEERSPTTPDRRG